MILGNPTFLPIELAASIADHARSVALLSDLASQPKGTAFLVDKDLVLTAGYIVTEPWRQAEGWSDHRFLIDFDHTPNNGGDGRAQSWLDQAPYPWVDAAASEFHSLLADAYGPNDRRLGLLAMAGVPSKHLLLDGTPYGAWRQALEVTANMGRTRQVAEMVLEDESVSGFHVRIRELLPTTAAPIEATPIAVSDDRISWAALKLSQPSSRPPLTLGSTAGVAPGGGVIIIQHPFGGPQKFVLEPEGIIGLTDEFVQYRADTRPGSGGAPVFDEKMQVIGIHRGHDPRTRAHNVGIRIERVTDGLEHHDLNYVHAPSKA